LETAAGKNWLESDVDIAEGSVEVDVELEGRLASGIGCEVLTRDAIGREEVLEGGENVSRLYLMDSMVVDGRREFLDIAAQVLLGSEEIQ
jgi:hypothetical protein